MQSILNILQNLLWKFTFFLQSEVESTAASGYAYDQSMVEDTLGDIQKSILTVLIAFCASLFAMLCSTLIFSRFAVLRILILLISIGILFFIDASINLHFLEEPSLFSNPWGITVLVRPLSIFGLATGFLPGYKYRSIYIKRKMRRYK